TGDRLGKTMISRTAWSTVTPRPHGTAHRSVFVQPTNSVGEYRGEQVGGSADSFCERIKHRIEARRIRIGSGQRPRCGCYVIAVQVPDELDYVLHCLRKCQSTSARTSPGRALA